MSFTQGGIGDAWSPSKIKGVRETGNNCRKPEKTKRHALFPLIPTRAFESSVDDSKRNMEEIGDKYERSGKFTERTRLSDMSPQKKLFQGYWRCLGPSKNQRWAAAICYKYRTSLEVGNNCGKPKKSKHVLFSPIPTRTLESSLDDSKGNMEEIGDKYERSGKCTKGTRLSFISPEKK